MKFKGVVFDFNGTLLWDTGLHNKAWDIFLSRHQLSLSDGEKHKKIHGRNNELIFPDIFGREMPPDEVHSYVIEKETIYRKLCVKSGIGYAPGAEAFIGFLRENGIPYAIATASGKENIDFYIQKMRLDKLIDPAFILYNNGTYKSKPDPDMFLSAIKRLRLTSSEVVIFEDSNAGIKAAAATACGKVMIVKSGNEDYSEFGFEMITDFNQVNRSIFDTGMYSQQ
jgi:HAD superfamily hydrolase (TIGR01509 family)